MNTLSDWFTKPMRWAQLTLTDTDPGSFDPDMWLDYFRRARCDGAVISSGGYIAYYPTEIPYHYRSKTMGSTDPFGYLVEGCRKRDMSVICRSDAHATHADAMAAHPEWIAVTEEGAYREHWSMPDVWVTCALGAYTFDFMSQVNQEIVRLYDIDAIFCNRWAGSGICYCESCKKMFRDYCGLEIPGSDADGNTKIRYLEWREKRLFELCDLWNEQIQAIKPHARFIPNSGGGALSMLDMVHIGEYSDILFIDRQARRGNMAPWANGKNGKELRAVMRGKPIGGIFSTGNEEAQRWKDSVQHEAELRVWVSDAVANGLRPWFTKFCGRVYDDRWMPVVEDLYNRYADWEEYLRYNEPVADVALVYSQQTARHYGREQARELVEGPLSGFYQILVENRILFDMVHVDHLDDIRNYKTVILPNIAILSDEQCETLRQYVAAGGGLIATYETSLYGAEGNRLDDFGLADLFGVHADGERQGPMKNSYIQVNHSEEVNREGIHVGLEKAGRIINGVNRVPVTLSDEHGDLNAFTFVPPYPDLPMEEVYPRDTSDIPELCFKAYGKGRVAYFCSDIDRSYWNMLTPDHGQVMINAVHWAAQNQMTVSVEGPGFIDVTMWENGANLCLHIVNMTNPMAMRGVIKEILPISGITLRVMADPPSEVRSLSTGELLDWTHRDGAVYVTAPEIQYHEAIVFLHN